MMLNSIKKRIIICNPGNGRQQEASFDSSNSCKEMMINYLQGTAKVYAVIALITDRVGWKPNDDKPFSRGQCTIKLIPQNQPAMMRNNHFDKRP